MIKVKDLGNILKDNIKKGNRILNTFIKMHYSFFKYIAVGAINTIVTTLIIFVLMYFNVNIFMSNASGYIVGIALSFILNSIFTFNSKITQKKLIKFLTVCFISYLLNLLTINIMLNVSKNNVYYSQLFGILVYTLTGYFLNRKWAMK